MPYGSIEEQPQMMISSGGTVIEQLPNSREIPDHVQRVSSRSKTKKINKVLAFCKRGEIATEKAEFPLRYIDSLQQGRAILKHNSAVTILQSAGKVPSGAMGWKVFSYAG